MTANIGRWIASGVVLLALTISGCASTSQKGASLSSKEQLEQRAAERAQLFAEGKFEEAWAYTTPGYRAATPVKEYIDKSAIRPVTWLDAEVIGAEGCEESAVSCEVQLQVRFRIEMPMRGAGRVVSISRVKETWMRVNGIWYFMPDDLRK